MTNYHLTNDGENWKLTREGADRASAVFHGSTKIESIQQAAQHMQGTGGSLKIHNLDGTFSEERTYPKSADPRTSKG